MFSPRRGFVLLGMLILGSVLCAVPAVGGPVDSTTIMQPGDLELSGQSPEILAAISQFRRGERESALKSLEAAAKSDPELPPPRVMLARMLLFDREVDAARKLLEEVASQLPEYLGTYALFGNLAMAEGRISDAQAQYEKVLRLAEESKDQPDRKRLEMRGWSGLASVAEARRDWTTATDALRHCLERDPANGSARQRLARALFNSGEVDKATSELEQAVRDDGRLEPVETQLGRLYADAKEPEVALRWLQEGTRKSPDDARAHAAVALFHSQQERPEEALPAIENALKLDANGRQTQLLAAIVCRQLADYTTAEKHLQRLFDENPTDFQVINLLALVLIEQPREADHRRALQLAQMNTQRFPKSNEARATLGWIQLRQGRLDEASKALQGALSQGAATPDTAYYIARRHAKLGETNEALRLLNQALEAPLGRFAYRKQAQTLLKQLSDEAKSTTGASKTKPKERK